MPAARAIGARIRANVPRSLAWTASRPSSEIDAENGRVGEQRRPERPVVGGADGEPVRPVGHEPADRPEVARCGEAAGIHDQHGLGEPLDLLEDVRREQDRPTLGGHPPEQLHHVQPLAGIHAVERLVEQQDPRLVDERRGELDPLAHALRIGPDLAIGRVGQLDRADRPVRGGGRVGRCPAARR